MKTCRKLEKLLAAGKYDDSFHVNSPEMRSHVAECSSCKELLDAVTETESRIRMSLHTTLAPRTRARLRIAVSHAIQDTDKHVFSKFVHAWILFAAVGIAAVLFLVKPAHRITGPNEFPVAFHYDREVIQDVLDIVETDFYHVDESDLQTAVWMKTDSELVSTGLETWFGNAISFYDEDYLKILSDMDDTDWALLRRYII